MSALVKPVYIPPEILIPKEELFGFPFRVWPYFLFCTCFAQSLLGFKTFCDAAHFINRVSATDGGVNPRLCGRLGCQIPK